MRGLTRRGAGGPNSNGPGIDGKELTAVAQNPIRAATGPDPLVVRRSRDLLDRADTLLANADGVDDPAERFRQYYLAALRGAGALLAVHEPPKPARGRRPVDRSAWARLTAKVPEWAAAAEYLASLSQVRAGLEDGSIRGVDRQLPALLRTYVTALLDDAEAAIVAYEQGKPGNGGRGDVHLVS